jgi:outer membrane protein OmpA-like peptidoglycan-associated protein
MIVFSILILTGCESVQLVEAVKPFDSRMVYMKAHDYQGTNVVISRNWLLGEGRGLDGLSEYKLDMPTDGLGAFFKVAVDDMAQSEAANTDDILGADDSANNSLTDTHVKNGAKTACYSDLQKRNMLGQWTLYFDTNSATPNNLKAIIKELEEISPTEVAISGHTDDKGNDLYNMKLSKKRSLKTHNLIKGVWETNNYEVTWGGECPRAVLNIDENSRALNRRVVITAFNTVLVDAVSSNSEEFK